MAATYTENLNLELPAGDDYAQISILNSNFEKIDSYCITESSEQDMLINNEILDENETNILKYNSLNNICYINGNVYIKSDIELSNKYLLGGEAPAAICGQVCKAPNQKEWISVDTIGNIYLETEDNSFDYSTINPISFGFTYINKISKEEQG